MGIATGIFVCDCDCCQSFETTDVVPSSRCLLRQSACDIPRRIDVDVTTKTRMTANHRVAKYEGLKEGILSSNSGDGDVAKPTHTFTVSGPEDLCKAGSS